MISVKLKGKSLICESCDITQHHLNPNAEVTVAKGEATLFKIL